MFKVGKKAARRTHSLSDSQRFAVQRRTQVEKARLNASLLRGLEERVEPQREQRRRTGFLPVYQDERPSFDVDRVGGKGSRRLGFNKARRTSLVMAAAAAAAATPIQTYMYVWMYVCMYVRGHSLSALRRGC